MDMETLRAHEHGPIDGAIINKNCACFNLRKAMRAVTQFFDHNLEHAGIRSTQFNLLVTLGSVSAKTLTELAHHMVMDRTTLTRNLKPLEKLNLIQTVVPKDKRSKAYTLTEHGREVLNKALPSWEKAQSKVVNAMGEERFNHMLSELNNMVKIFEHDK